MTEAEWLTSDDPNKLLVSFPLPTQRKTQLFACACCHQIKHLLTDKGLRAIAGTERAIDGLLPLAELFELQPDMSARYGSSLDADSAVSWALRDGQQDPSGYLPGYLYAAQWSASASRDAPAQWRIQADLVRDIFANSFRPVNFATAWLTSDVLALARQMYESREFSAMPILADALQDAGCDNPDVLNHCRGDGPHVRGCWVVDLVLGKE